MSLPALPANLLVRSKTTVQTIKDEKIIFSFGGGIVHDAVR